MKKETYHKNLPDSGKSLCYTAHIRSRSGNMRVGSCCRHHRGAGDVVMTVFTWSLW